MTTQMAELYTKITEFLGKALGPDFEITLHDVNNRNNSIIAIANGYISGRGPGAPMSTVLQEILDERRYESNDYYINYTGVAAGNNKLLRSSVMFLRDEEGELTGLLCINFDDSRYQDLSDRLLRLRHPNTYTDAQNGFRRHRVSESSGSNGSITSVTEAAIAEVLEKSNVPLDRLTLDEKMNIVGVLEDKGVFLIKGTVKQVAQRLHCSQASVYRYLNRISRDKEKENKNPS